MNLLVREGDSNPHTSRLIREKAGIKFAAGKASSGRDFFQLID
jgi:hypothetical protein